MQYAWHTLKMKKKSMLLENEPMLKASHSTTQPLNLQFNSKAKKKKEYVDLKKHGAGNAALSRVAKYTDQKYSKATDQWSE